MSRRATRGTSRMPRHSREWVGSSQTFGRNPARWEGNSSRVHRELKVLAECAPSYETSRQERERLIRERIHKQKERQIRLGIVPQSDRRTNRPNPRRRMRRKGVQYRPQRSKEYHERKDQAIISQLNELQITVKNIEKEETTPPQYPRVFKYKFMPGSPNATPRLIPKCNSPPKMNLSSPTSPDLNDTLLNRIAEEEMSQVRLHS